MTTGFETIWSRVLANVGQTFHTSTGLPFSYKITEEKLCVSRTNYPTSQANMLRAFNRMPVKGPAYLGNIMGRSYVWAILNDPRIATYSKQTTAKPKETKTPGKWHPCILIGSIPGYTVGARFEARKTSDGKVEIRNGWFEKVVTVEEARQNFKII